MSNLSFTGSTLFQDLQKKAEGLWLLQVWCTAAAVSVSTDADMAVSSNADAVAVVSAVAVSADAPVTM